MKKKKILKIEKQLRETRDGRLEGGFAMLVIKQMTVIVGGISETNNCRGQNCATNCGPTNSVPGCGGVVNTVAGCGQHV